MSADRMLANKGSVSSLRIPLIVSLRRIVIPSIAGAIFLAVANLGIGGFAVMGASNHAILILYRMTYWIFPISFCLCLMYFWRQEATGRKLTHPHL